MMRMIVHKFYYIFNWLLTYSVISSFFFIVQWSKRAQRKVVQTRLLYHFQNIEHICQHKFSYLLYKCFSRGDNIVFENRRMAIRQSLIIRDHEIPWLEDWDQELKEEQRPSGRMRWVNGEAVFVFDHEYVENKNRINSHDKWLNPTTVLMATNFFEKIPHLQTYGLCSIIS